MIKKNIGQLYRVILTEDAREHAFVAGFVFPDNNSDVITGFITEIDKEQNELEICLFKQAQYLPENCLILEEKMSSKDVQILLARALRENPEMVEHWKDTLLDE